MQIYLLIDIKQISKTDKLAIGILNITAQ